MKILIKLLPFIVILILSVFSFKPLLNSGFFPIHDDTQVARVYEMTKALRDGMFPVRWVSDLGYGYGYPIFNFYDPLPYYIGGAINLLGVDALLATKLIMILGIIFSSLFMYLLAKEFWGEFGGILSALFYVYAPYHGVDIYVRGDIAEFFAYAFIPLFFYGLWKVYKEYKWKYVVICAVSYGAIITSHNLTAMMVTPFILVFVSLLVYKSFKNKKKIFYFIPSVILGILLSAFYSFPAILEMNYTNVLSQVGGGASFSDHFVCLNQLWASPWGYGGSAKGCIDGISFMIGKSHIILSLILFIVSIFILIFNKHLKYFQKDKENLLVIIISFLGFLFSIFLTLEISKPLWELIKPMAFFQYPWRFLIMIVFFSSFISGSLFWFSKKFIKNKNLNFLFVILTLGFFILVSVKFFIPQKTLNKNSQNYINDYSLKWETSKISDEYMPQKFNKPNDFYEIPDISNLKTKDLDIKIINRKTQELNLSLNVYKSGFYILPVAYFPAWKGYINKSEINLKENSRGITIDLFKGKYNFKLVFVQTPVEVISNIISIAGILVLFAGIILLRPKHD